MLRGICRDEPVIKFAGYPATEYLAKGSGRISGSGRLSVVLFIYKFKNSYVSHHVGMNCLWIFEVLQYCTQNSQVLDVKMPDIRTIPSVLLRATDYPKELIRMFNLVQILCQIPDRIKTDIRSFPIVTTPCNWLPEGAHKNVLFSPDFLPDTGYRKDGYPVHH